MSSSGASLRSKTLSIEAMRPRHGSQRPEAFQIDGLTFALSPYGVGKKPAAVPCQGCDVLVSHYPPYGVLDMCYNDKSAGSPGLKKAVERLKSPPHLWLFGHIHEARGGTHRATQFHSSALRSPPTLRSFHSRR